MILVEADISPEWDSSGALGAIAEDAVRAAVGASRYSALIASDLAVEVSVKFASDEEVRSLNATWRHKDKPTNVLSFPMLDADLLGSAVATGDGEMLLGDIVLAHGVCVREAEEKGVGVNDHAAHLVVHGTLHLLGYDHEQGEEAAEAMEALERAALSALGIADPYAAEVSA